MLGLGHGEIQGSREDPGGRREQADPSPLFDRRLGLPVPRLSCLAADEPAGRHADQRGVRLLPHAGGRPAGQSRDRPHRDDPRRRQRHLPQQDLRQVQGQPARSAGGPDPAIPADPRGRARLQCHGVRTRGLRGRRPDRDLRPPGAGSRRHLHHRLVRQGPDAAGAAGRGADGPDQEDQARARGGDGEVRRDARQGRRRAGAGGRFDRQRAGRAGHRHQDGGAAHQRIRVARNAAGAHQGDQAAQAARIAGEQCRADPHLQAARVAAGRCPGTGRSRFLRQAPPRSQRAAAVAGAAGLPDAAAALHQRAGRGHGAGRADVRACAGEEGRAHGHTRRFRVEEAQPRLHDRGLRADPGREAARRVDRRGDAGRHRGLRLRDRRTRFEQCRPGRRVAGPAGRTVGRRQFDAAARGLPAADASHARRRGRSISWATAATGMPASCSTGRSRSRPPSPG